MSYWSVVQSHPAAERRATWHLERQGFEVYAPREKIIRIVRGKKQVRSRYLFPRYLFVWVSDYWHDLFRTDGISKVLLTGEQPARMPERWVDQMRGCEHNGLIVLPKHRFRIGQAVLVTAGLFEGARGLYQGMTSQQREIVLLDALGARVELSPGLLR